MGFLFNSRGYVQLDGYVWKTGPGKCDNKCKEYRKECGYIGSGKKCISTLTNHTCKHFINEDVDDREAMINNGLLEHDFDFEKYNIRCYSKAKETEESNDAIKIYRKISEESLNSIDYAIASKGNVLLHGTGKYEGFVSFVGVGDKNVKSFYHNDYSSENYCFFSLIERICWDKKHGEYYIPNKIPEWIDAEHIAYEGDKWLKSCTKGCLGMNERILSAFSERPEDIDNVRDAIRSVVFHYYYNRKNCEDISILNKSKKGGTVDTRKRALFEMLYSHYALGVDGIKHLDIEEKCYPFSYGKSSDLVSDIFSKEDWKLFDSYLAGNMMANIYKNIDSFELMLQSEEIEKDAEFLIDIMAQSIAMDVFTVKLLKHYAGNEHCILSDIDAKMESNPALNKWNKFYTFWAGIDWNPGANIVKKKLESYLEITDVLESKVEEDYDESDGFRIDSVSVDGLKYYYNYEEKTIIGKAEVYYRLVVRSLDGDESGYGYFDTDDEYNENISISFELKQNGYLEDIEVIEVLAESNITTAR